MNKDNEAAEGLLREPEVASHSEQLLVDALRVD